MSAQSKLDHQPQKEKPVQYPVLIGQQGPLEGQRWSVTSDMTIGRDPECDILIPDRQVSRLHAKITVSEDAIEIEDMDSKNGTFLQGSPLAKRTALNDGSVFQIALLQKFVFYITDATMPLEDLLVSPVTTGDALVLDKKSHRVWIGNKEVLPPLSVPQFKLLEVLYEHPGVVVTRDELIDMVWGSDQSVGVSDQALDALIRRLRERLSETDGAHSFIVTIRGHGLRFENSSE
jgi:DNA-binding winged helix-turn-helix (wHTH) protein